VINRARFPQPFHWIGIRKGWQTSALSIVGALVDLPLSDLETHLLIIGATGSGKSKGMEHLIAQCILQGRSFVIVDYRGDSVSGALELLAGRVDPAKIIVINLRDPDPSVAFNPLVGAGPVSVRALAFLAALETVHKEFGPQLADTMRNALLLMAECGEPITCLEKLLYNEEYREGLVKRSADENVRAYWSRYSEMSKEKQQLLAMPVTNKLSLLLAAPSLKAILGSSQTIDLAKHLNTPGTALLVSLAADQTSGAGRTFGNLILANLRREIFARVELDECARNPVVLFVDEFQNFNGDFEEILAEGRKYRLSLVLANQVLAQLDTTMRSLLLNNIGAKLVFRTGREDGAILSKDLTGDPKALDLANLPVGEAYLWRRSQELVHLEVNRPLLMSVGRRSPAVTALLTRIRENWNASKPIEPLLTVADSEQEATLPTRAAKTHARLEDWL
jgi:DNA helicase HerA-like ATPase